jgi:hypothetical protein
MGELYFLCHKIRIDLGVIRVTLEWQLVRKTRNVGAMGSRTVTMYQKIRKRKIPSYVLIDVGVLKIDLPHLDVRRASLCTYPNIPKRKIPSHLLTL